MVILNLTSEIINRLHIVHNVIVILVEKDKDLEDLLHSVIKNGEIVFEVVIVVDFKAGN